MLIKLKNKNTLIIDDFKLKCSIGIRGINSKKKEGDLCIPCGKGSYSDEFNASKCQPYTLEGTGIEIIEEFSFFIIYRRLK